jgi:hypothetical protein
MLNYHQSTERMFYRRTPMPTETKSRKGIGGPKTKEGKEKIRLNALKLGLYAQSIEGMQAVADVVGVTFEEIHQKMLDYYHPTDPLEETLVRRIARCTWKLRLVETMEDHLLQGLAVRSAPGRSLEGISVIERRTDVQLHRAIAALSHKRRHEQENEKNKLTEPSEPVAPPQPVTGLRARRGSRSRAFPAEASSRRRALGAKPRRRPKNKLKWRQFCKREFVSGIAGMN